MSFDLDAALRWIKPQRWVACPPLRSKDQLFWARDAPLIGGPLLLDTTVYIDLLHGVTPRDVDELLEFRICNHSAVSLAELTHAFGRLDPTHPDTKSALKQIHGVITLDISPRRLHAPESDVWGAAGILAGMAFRLRRLPKNQGHERRLLNDALLYLQARKLGWAVLTRNIDDFDILNQLIPDGQILLYRRMSE